MDRHLRTARRAAALVVSALAVVSVSGCGGDGDSASTPSSSSVSSSSDTGTLQSSPTPGESSPAESSSSGSAQSTSSGSADDVGEKPSKEDVVSGLQDFYSEEKPPGSEDLDTDAFAQCMVDKGYDDWSVKTVNAVKDGKPEEIDRDDSASFAEYGSQCTQSQP